MTGGSRGEIWRVQPCTLKSGRVHVSVHVTMTHGTIVCTTAFNMYLSTLVKITISRAV